MYCLIAEKLINFFQMYRTFMLIFVLDQGFSLLANGVDLLRILIFLGSDRETVSQSEQTLGKPFIDGAALLCGSSRTWTGNKH